MRVSPVGRAAGSTQPGQGSPGGAFVLRVVPGTFAHTKETTGLTHLNEVVGRWIQTPPAHFYGRELRSNERGLGTGGARLKAANTLEHENNDRVNKWFLVDATAIDGQLQQRNTARVTTCASRETCAKREPEVSRRAKVAVRFGSRFRAAKGFALLEAAPLKQPPTRSMP